MKLILLFFVIGIYALNANAQISDDKYWVPIARSEGKPLWYEMNASTSELSDNKNPIIWIRNVKKSSTDTVYYVKNEIDCKNNVIYQSFIGNWVDSETWMGKKIQPQKIVHVEPSTVNSLILIQICGK